LSNKRPRKGWVTIPELPNEAGLAQLETLLSILDEIDPDELREAERAEAQAIMNTLVGATIKSATVEETRIVVETADGNRYYFYGLMGSGGASGESIPALSSSR
jgi:hypothetical protein